MSEPYEPKSLKTTSSALSFGAEFGVTCSPNEQTAPDR